MPLNSLYIDAMGLREGEQKERLTAERQPSPAPAVDMDPTEKRFSLLEID